MEDISQLKLKAQASKKANKKLITKLAKLNPREVDSIFHEAHEEAFQEVDCLECGNCCRTTGPLITNKDIDRLASHLRLKPGAFIEQYLRIDEDNDYVFQSMPCPFLGDDNYCSVYEFRPKACREYPHTDRVKQSQLLKLHIKNTEVCPAVFQMVEKIKMGVNK